MTTKLLTGVLLLSFTCFKVQPAWADSLSTLDWRITKLEDYSEIADKKFENKSKELDLKIEEYNRQKTLLDWIALALGSVTVVSLWGFWQRAKAVAEKKVNERFETVFEEKKQTLIDLIHKHDSEHDLKCNSKICVVASQDANTDLLMKFFHDLGFATPQLIKTASYTSISEEINYDILFLFREETNNPLDDEVSKQYIANMRTDAVLFLFGKFIDPTNVKRRASSASFWSQLYGNLLSALKYQELID